MVPFPMVVRDELPERSPERRLSEEDHAIEAFLLDRTHEALGIRVAVGSPVRRADDPDAGRLQVTAEPGRELPIPVADEEAVPE